MPKWIFQKISGDQQGGRRLLTPLDIKKRPKNPEKSDYFGHSDQTNGKSTSKGRT